MIKGSKRSLIILMAAWICIPGAFLYWIEMDTRQEEKKLALGIAKAFFQQIVISRRWNASHDGVYVPITPQIQPNKYLTPPQNKILTTDNGLKLTNINPSYMTKELAELAKENEDGIQFHMTSLKPINPDNKATEWEKHWLNSFKHGSKEQGEFFDEGDTIWFRYMAPLLVERSCLKCHAQHGYNEGDIRGGLSVSVPFPSHTHFNIFFGYSAVVGIGLIFIYLGATFYERKRRLFDATFDSPVPTCITDSNFTILMANESYWAEFGALPTPPKTILCYDHRPGESCHTTNCPLTRIMGGSSSYTYEAIKVKAGETQHFIVNAKPLLDARDKVVGVVESFQEITDRKQAEEALADSNRKLQALSNTDGLTGIANRRYFDKVLAQEYTRHTRSEEELSLILLDIDYFKLFNDFYGHIHGDECLQEVARVIAACAARPADLAARYGGEEFACILPETDRKGAIGVAEKIRREIIARAIPHKDSKIAECVTASFGVVTVRCTPNGSATDVVAQVDDLLYRAKSSGRNRVESLTPSDIGEGNKDPLVQLAWKDSFCCGNEMIDSQHKALFLIANELLEAVLSPRPATTEIAAIISRLLDDVSQHFHDEELILQKINFPGMSQHVAEHAELLAKAQKMAEELKASTLSVGDVFQFLASGVVIQHMLEADREFFPFIKGGSD